MLDFNTSPSKSFLPAYKRKSPGICLKPKFNNEAIAESIEPHHYLSDLARSGYQVILNNGQFKQGFAPLNGSYLYVLLPDNTFYCVPEYIGMNHSYLAQGKPVKAAGMIYCRQGRVITISNESGHYQPDFQQMLPALNWLFDASRYPFIFEDHSVQDEGAKLNGVRYFKVEKPYNTLTTSKVELDQLAKVLCDIDGEMEYEENITINELKIPEIQEDSPNCYYSFLPKTSPSALPTKHGMDANFYNQLSILYYTFLGLPKKVNAPFSRYTGVLRQMNQY